MQYILVSSHLSRISVGEIDLTQFQLYKTIHKSRLDTSIVYLNSILAIHFNVGSCRRTRRLVPFLYHTSSIGVFVHYLSEKECCRPALVFMSNRFYVRSFYFLSSNLHRGARRSSALQIFMLHTINNINNVDNLSTTSNRKSNISSIFHTNKTRSSDARSETVINCTTICCYCIYNDQRHRDKTTFSSSIMRKFSLPSTTIGRRVQLLFWHAIYVST